MDNTTGEKAMLYYERHLESLRKYYTKNKDKIKQRSKQQYEQDKMNPDKYNFRLAKARERYHKKKAEMHGKTDEN